MTYLSKAARYLLTLLAGIVAGYLLLVAVYMLPVEPMAQNVRASVPALQGEWGREDAYEQLVKGYVTTQLDNSTDAVMMLAAVHESEASPFVQAAEARNAMNRGTAYDALLAFAQGQEMESVAVARYWHGYLVLLKPLLMILSYLDIRVLLMLVQGAMLAAVIAGMCQRNIGFLIPAFAVSMICITPQATGFSLQFTTSMCTFLGTMIVLLYVPSQRILKTGLPYVFLLTGMFTSYVDYLTYPIATLGMPICLCLFLFPEADWKAELHRYAACCICWAAGYFGMWAGKWIIAGFLSDEPWFWANLFAKIQQRSSAESDQTIITYMDVLISQIKPFAKRAYLLAGVALLIGWSAAVVRCRRYPSRKINAVQTLLLVLSALMPFAWYFVTKNHSYNHAFFTSRALAVTVFSLVSLMMQAIGTKAKPVKLDT